MTKTVQKEVRWKNDTAERKERLERIDGVTD